MKMVNVIRLLAVFAGFFLSLNLFAQDQCGTDQLMMRNPFLMEAYNSRVACAPEIDLDTAQVLTIPVVFHILHLGEAVGEETNISDAQILSCIENLNHRFRGDVEALAALTDQYDEYELSLVKDGKIEFCLAARDPDNNPTDGINRYDCSDLTYSATFAGQPVFESYAEDGIASDGTQNGVPDNYVKNLFHWPEDKYFNCYVVSEIGGNNGNNGIQGYSFVGSLGLGGSGYRYGPVCLYNVTGTVGTLKPGRELNATWAHEIGHAFNLFHTFSNGFSTSDCTPETNPCTQGDQCPDTPPTPANQGCNPDFANCPDAMIQNYMDYSGEACRTAFSQNQIERMREEIYTQLDYLVSVNNVSCQSPNSRDVAITSITAPSDWCLSTLDFNVKINNFGGEAAENVTLLVNGVSYEVPTIGAGGFVIIPFTDFVLGDGIIECEAVYELDEFLNNNALTQVVEVTEQSWLEVAISPDVWSNEIDWEITDENGDVVLYDGDWPVFSQDETFTESTCLPDGCYTFTITDTNGDGMCAFDFDEDGICDSNYDAFINITANGELIFDVSDPSEIDYGSELIFDFCVEYSCPLETDLCPWDLNDDNRVNSNDLLVLLTTINQDVGPCTQGDFNFDGVINQDDLNILLDNYGLICAEETIQNKNLTINNEQNEGACLVGPPLYFDMLGNQVKYSADLPSGIYIVVEKWSNGDIITKKILLNSWQN